MNEIMNNSLDKKDTFQDKNFLFENLFFVIHKENSVLNEKKLLLTKSNSSLIEDVENLKQIIFKKDYEEELTNIQNKEKREKSLNELYKKDILDRRIQISTVNLSECTSDNKKHKFANYNDTYKSYHRDNYDDNLTYCKRQKKNDYSTEFLSDFYPYVQSKYIYMEEYLLKILKNTNIKSGEIKDLFPDGILPSDIYLTLSCYDRYNNKSFIDNFWIDKNNKNTDFSIIFNKRNPNFVIKLNGKGSFATFEKV